MRQSGLQAGTSLPARRKDLCLPVVHGGEAHTAWDGRIRMDPSSPYAMRSLVALKDQFDLAFGCDTDHDRHGIVTKSSGLMPPNHYLAVCVQHLFLHRPQWSVQTAVGKTVVSSSIIDRVTSELGRKLYEVPVGFKWFVSGLLDGTLFLQEVFHSDWYAPQSFAGRVINCVSDCRSD